MSPSHTRLLPLLIAGVGIRPAAAQIIYPLPESDHAESYEALMTGWSLAVVGGVQLWDLTTIENIIAINAENLTVQGFQLEAQSFAVGPAFGAELAYHIGGKWRARLHAEYTRFAVEDRYGSAIAFLGGGNPFLSIGYETVVESKWFLTTLGLQRSHLIKGIAFSWGAGVVIAPVRVVEKFANWANTEPSPASQDATSTGTGYGLEITLTVDYLLDGPNTIYIDGFYRNGSTTVKLEEPGLDGSLTPGSREAEWSGVGLRLGMRFN